MKINKSYEKISEFLRKLAPMANFDKIMSKHLFLNKLRYRIQSTDFPIRDLNTDQRKKKIERKKKKIQKIR